MTARRLVHAASAALLAATASGPACTSNDAATGGTTRSGLGQVRVSVSGEDLGQQGFPFPPTDATSPFFVDGWALSFDKLLVNVDDVTLSTDPDSDPNDQSRVGAVVARAKGPWLVDVHKAGALPGKGGGNTATLLTTIPDQTENGGAAFASDTKYAFGFHLVPAAAASVLVNVDAADADVVEMRAQGYSVFYVGTARFGGATCSLAAADAGPGSTLDALPRTVRFRLGFTTRSAFVNCQNPDLGDTTGGDGNPRGLYVKDDGSSVAQITIHSDHAFWSRYREDAPLRFDAFAWQARAAAGAAVGSIPTVTLPDLAGVPYAPVQRGSVTLPNRTCSPSPAPVSTDLAYDAEGEPFVDLLALVSALQASQGHLNADGLCVVQPLP